MTIPDTQCVIQAIRLLRKEFGDEVGIIGKTMGRGLGYHSFGVEPLFAPVAGRSRQDQAGLDKLKEITIQFGLAQFEAGADA